MKRLIAAIATLAFLAAIGGCSTIAGKSSSVGQKTWYM